ncbi:putative cellobiose dehydrogenase [Dendryphion nanum]|uniref:Cellobiose dehydrogenase n=1 Tax=Dendryphion nanum TaxID=256645 RepID=A0A9P9D5T5_9PLEO|nr:putative cellobiose dehydrogenase [Dendryphion nanum]
MHQEHSAILFNTILFISVLCTAVSSQITTPFVDQATGIQFQRFFGARSNFGFGIALPLTPSDSFIGQLSFPLRNGAGWGGWSLTGDMEGPLLMAAWSDGTNVVSSFRQAANEDDNPPEVTGTFSARTIAEGTSVNSSFLTYTFLCEGCLNAAFGLGAAATAGTAEMGWALASTAVRNPQSSAGILGFHNTGFGEFEALLGQARSAEFDTWAALAGAPVLPAVGALPFRLNAGEDGGEESGDEGGGNGSDDEDDD